SSHVRRGRAARQGGTRPCAALQGGTLHPRGARDEDGIPLGQRRDNGRKRRAPPCHDGSAHDEGRGGAHRIDVERRKGGGDRHRIGRRRGGAGGGGPRRS